MIFDCFPFFNEFELLAIRLHELDPWVDRFVLVESTETFSGNSKPLYFSNYSYLFKSFLPKIIHLVAPPAVKPKDAWERQSNQRDFVMTVLPCSDDDLILIGDTDEIPRGQDFADLHERKNKRGMSTFMQTQYIYYMNLWRPGGWPGTIMLPFKNLKSDYGGSLFDARMKRRSGALIRKGGWHFPNMGGEEAVLLKTKSSGHFDSKVSKKILTEPGFLYNRMEVERAVKARKLDLVPIDDSYPIWFKENTDKFKHLLTEEKK